MLIAMLISVHSRLRRHRRMVMWALAVLAVVGVALTARAVLMSAHGHVGVSDALAICMTVGGCVAIAGIAVFALPRVARRPLWRVVAQQAPALVFVPSGAGVLVRAGPPPAALLQVFRL